MRIIEGVDFQVDLPGVIWLNSTLYLQQQGSSMQSVGVGEKLVERCSDKLAKAHQLKDEGNREFKAGGYRAAIKKYHHSLMYTRGVVSTGDVSVIPGMEQMVKYVATEDEKIAAKELSLILSNNLAGMPIVLAQTQHTMCS